MKILLGMKNAKFRSIVTFAGVKRKGMGGHKRSGFGDISFIDIDTCIHTHTYIHRPTYIYTHIIFLKSEVNMTG